MNRLGMCSKPGEGAFDKGAEERLREVLQKDEGEEGVEMRVEGLRAGADESQAA